MKFKGRRTTKLHNFKMRVVPGCKYIEKLKGDVQWYMMENKNFKSCISCKLKNENGSLITSNGQSNTLGLLIKEV